MVIFKYSVTARRKRIEIRRRKKRETSWKHEGSNNFGLLKQVCTRNVLFIKNIFYSLPYGEKLLPDQPNKIPGR